MFEYSKEIIKSVRLRILGLGIFGLAVLISPLHAAEPTPSQTPAPALLETQIRNLYAPFKDGYKVASPVNGMLVLSEILPNVRFKGRYGPKNDQFLCHYQITHPAEDHQPTSDVDCPQDYTSTIVQHFFPSPAGGILRLPALEGIDLIARFNIQAIGELLRIYVSYTKEMTEAKEVSKIIQVRGKFSQNFKEFFAKRLQSLKNDKGAYKSLAEQWEKAGISVDNLPELYAQMFMKAFDEQAHYPAHLVEYTLLAYAWKKSDKKEQLLNLFDGSLKEFLQPKDPKQPKTKVAPFSEDLYYQWKQEAVENNRLKPEEFQKWLQDPEKLIFMTIGYHLFENPYPRMLDFSQAIYTNNLEPLSFMDCGETSVRNFLNFMISTNRSFDPKLLVKAFPNIRKEILIFYQEIQPSYNQVLGIAKDRNAWANSISGLNAEKVSYRGEKKVCNIMGEGIDNILAVLGEIFNDEKLQNISLPNSKKGQNTEQDRAQKLQYIIDQFNKAKQGIVVSWSESGQSETLSAYPVITLMVNDLPVFEWRFKPSHFTFVTIVDKEKSSNWLINSAVGFEGILHSGLPDSLKRLLLPFYSSGTALHPYLSAKDKQQEVKKYVYDFLFGSPMGGNQQILEALDIALFLDNENLSMTEFSKTLIGKSFSVPDAAGDRMLVALWFRHKDILGEPTAQVVGERVAQLYHEIMDNLKPIDVTGAFSSQKMEQLTRSTFENLFSTPFAQDLIINAITTWPKKYLNFLGDVRLKEGMTILHAAADNDYLDIVETILKNEQLSNLFLTEKLIKDSKDNTPLHLAASKGNLSIVEALLKDKQAHEILLDQNNIKNNSGSTPLHLATFNGHLFIVEALLENEQACLVFLKQENIRNKSKRTPLHLAVNRGHISIVKALLKNKQVSPIYLKQENIKVSGETLLHLAVKNGYLSIVKTLLNDDNASLVLLNQGNIKNEEGMTPLHFAASYGHLLILEALLENELARSILLKQDNIKDIYAQTALHIAAAGGHLSIVAALLADKDAREILLSQDNIKDNEKKTPLDLAPDKDKAALIEIFEKYNVKLD